MADYPQSLNKDAVNNLFTSARYDFDASRWISDIRVTGNDMELYGATIEERPAANTVRVGTTFTLLNKDFDSWFSNGTNWLEV